LNHRRAAVTTRHSQLATATGLLLMFRSSQFLAAITRPHPKLLQNLRTNFAHRSAHFPRAEHDAGNQHQQRILEPGAAIVTKASPMPGPLHLSAASQPADSARGVSFFATAAAVRKLAEAIYRAPKMRRPCLASQ
jgi:hypothetical protein